MRKLILLAFLAIGCSKEDPCPCITAQAPYDFRIINPPDPDAPGAQARRIVLESFELSLPSCNFPLTEYENLDGSFSEYFRGGALDRSEWLELQARTECR